MPDNIQGQHTLCIIHGWGFDAQIMSGLASALSPSWNIRLLDMPGYGLNRMTKSPQNIDEISSNLRSAIPHNSILVGWSLGGMVAIKIAHNMRHKLKAIVLLASTPCFVRKKDWSHGIEATLINEMSIRLSRNDDQVFQEFARFVARGDVSPGNTVRNLQSFIKLNKANPKALQHGLNILVNSDLRKEFYELECQVIMLLGERDHLVSNSTGHAAKELRPSLRLGYINKTGHAPFISKNKETAVAINNSLCANQL